MRGFDPYNRSMSDFRRIVSVLAYRMAGGPHRRPVHFGIGVSSRAPKPEEHDSAVRQVSLRNEWSVDSRTADDSCGEGCAQLDDFNWFLPADDRVRDLPVRESEVDVSDSESEVDYIEPDDDDDGCGIVVPSGGHSNETYGGL